MKADLHPHCDASPLCQHVRQCVSPQRRPQRRLGQRVCGRVAIFHPRHPERRVHHPVKHDGVHLYRNPVCSQDLGEGDGGEASKDIRHDQTM